MLPAHSNLLFLPYWFSAAVSLVVCYLCWRRRSVRGALPFALAALGESLWTIGYIFELATPSLAGKIFWDSFQFLGMFVAPTGFILFTLTFADLHRPKSGWIIFGALLITCASLFIILEDPAFGQIRISPRLVAGTRFNYLVYEYAPALWVIFLITYLLTLLPYPILIQKLRRDNATHRSQTAFILAGTLIPIAGAAFSLLRQGDQRDMMPITFGISNIVIAWGLFRYQLFDPGPLARPIIIDKIQTGIIVINNQGQIVDLNPAAAKILGKQVVELANTLTNDALKDWPELSASVEQALNEPESSKIPVYHPERGYLELQVTPLYRQSSRRAGALIILDDLTARKLLEDSLRLNMDDLERANAELESFAYSVAHNLRSPLRAMEGFSQILSEEYGRALDEDGQEFLWRIRSASQQMALMLDKLLMLSNISRRHMQFEKVNLSQIAFKFLAQKKLEAPQRLAHFDVMPDLTVGGDPYMLKILLENLLDNAWKFSQNRAETQIEFWCTEIDNTPTFYVRDNGSGFEMRYADKLFQTFQHLHSPGEFEGAGIGLAIAERILHRHRGRIWAEGEEGKGATFYFTL